MKGTSLPRGSAETADGMECRDGVCTLHQNREGEPMSITTEGNHRVITIGIDLAENVFAVHGVDDSGKPALVKPKVARADLLSLILQLLPCLVSMKACSGAHRWARQFRTMATPSA